jgi:hypothetical protein
MSYLYWVAYCKTFRCKNARVVKFGGPCIEGSSEKFQISLPKNLTIKCPVCLKSYEYESAEIIAVVKADSPPLDFVNLF